MDFALQRSSSGLDHRRSTSLARFLAMRAANMRDERAYYLEIYP